jgi:lysophospholipase L1-like esterase
MIQHKKLISYLAGGIIAVAVFNVLKAPKVSAAVKAALVEVVIPTSPYHDIRQKGHFDGVIDFDHVLADPDQPDHLKHDFDSGDHLHPSPAGFQAMANSIPHFLEGIMGKVEPDMRKMLCH